MSASRERLVKLHIDKACISELMGPDGLINLLPLVPIADVPKTILYIRFKFNERTYTDTFDAFWAYFTKVWMFSYDPRLWNIIGSSSVVEQRTNNALERYNRTLHQNFPNPNLSMTSFVSAIRNEANRYVKMCDDICNGHADQITHAVPLPYTFPVDYREFMLRP